MSFPVVWGHLSMTQLPCSRPYWLATGSQLTRRYYTTAYKMGVSPPFIPPPGATVSDDLRWVCLSTANCKLTSLYFSRLTDLSSWYSWYSIGTDSAENTTSHNFFIVAWHSYRRRSAENTVLIFKRAIVILILWLFLHSGDEAWTCT
jgi:hypothetical protein